MPCLSLYLLGPPRTDLDSEPIQVDTRKATALLAYMAINKGRHRRDALANLLWPEYDQAYGRAALRRTMSTLRQAFIAPLPDSGQSTWLDVGQFRARLDARRAHAHLESATGCARQRLGFDRLNGSAHGRWITWQQERTF